MNPSKSQNAVNVILLEYEKVIRELQNTIEDISQSDLTIIIDQETKNKDCKSIQTILTHIVGAGYSYCVYIENSRGIDSKRPERINHTTAFEYKKDLDNVLEYTRKTFSNIYDFELEVYDNDKKILTSWGQYYDIEQIIEHAIIHILRHRRQIEKFKMQLV